VVRVDSTLFGSDVLYVSYLSGSGTLDFDTLAAGASTFELTSISFKWLVRNTTSGIDFGLDVYDDAYGWRDNVFTVNGQGSSGDSGLITFNSAWQVTALRIHDGYTQDVAIDNLTVNDSRTAVSEPMSLLLLGLGLLGIGVARRKK
jgi:hypothetical protein